MCVLGSREPEASECGGTGDSGSVGINSEQAGASERRRHSENGGGNAQIEVQPGGGLRWGSEAGPGGERLTAVGRFLQSRLLLG